MNVRTGDTTGQDDQAPAATRTPAPVDPLFDPGDPALMTDPYPMYRRIREADPIHWSPLGMWVLSRYADVDAVQRDGRFDRGLCPCDPMLARFGGAGSRVAVAERYAEPGRLDVARRDVRSPSFGGGIHFCVGAPLARMEAEIVISSLLRRLGDVELAVDEPVWRSNAVLRGLVALPVTFRLS